MKQLAIIFFLFLSFPAFSQSTVSGVVLDAEKGKPIPFASVFLSNTSIGTKTDDVGHFELSIPNGRFDLVVSSIGYETHSQTIQSAEVNQLLTIKLKLREEKMETVVVEPFEKDGWVNWGNFFIENFIGNSEFASRCMIKNTGVIKFRDSKKNHQLNAYAFEPLEIENRALGYHITYQLENFSYDFNTHLLLITGYPFFQDLAAGSARKKKGKKQGLRPITVR
ncbi:MAG: carboxypeptidase-like regulatory domain-containing protein [Flavisolibacter sp.]